MKKVAIVTGSSRGIGYAIARRLGRDGFRVIVSATGPQEKYEQALAGLTADGTEWRYIRCDIADHDSRLHLIEETVRQFWRIDVLVNNAGVAPKVRADLLDMTEESFDRVVGTNTKGTMFMTQLVARAMLEQPVKGRRRGVIVNISSSSVAVSSVSRGEYCISKAGVAMITTLFADRLAAHDIQVYEIRPGVIETDMTRVVHKKYNDLIEQGVFPIARWGQPEDIAGAVSAFCSDKFLYSTGNYIDLDGGFHIRKL